MKVQRPSGSTPNRPSAVESSRRWSDSWRCRTSSSVAACRRALRRTIHEARDREQGGEHAVDDQQQPLRLPRRLAELSREPALELGQALVQDDRLLAHLGRAAGVEIALDDALMRLLGERSHLLDDEVAIGPGDDRLGHERNAMEPAEQPDQAADVVGVVAALHEAARAPAPGRGRPSAAPRGRRDRRAGPTARRGSAGSPLRGDTGRSRADGSGRPSAPSNTGSRRSRRRARTRAARCSLPRRSAAAR